MESISPKNAPTRNETGDNIKSEWEDQPRVNRLDWEDPPNPKRPKLETVGNYRGPTRIRPGEDTVWPPKADIQNKANKTCSVCKVTFDIRKSVLKHCQLVHGIKFKNWKRPGQSIANNAPMTPTEQPIVHKNGETP